eukprot:2580550-Pleurochrysis_carterae.AAC.2
MSQAAGKRDPLLRATHAESSSRSAARAKLEPFGFCSSSVYSRVRSGRVTTAGWHRLNVTVVGALASRIAVRMNQRVGRGQRTERKTERWRRSACVRCGDARD